MNEGLKREALVYFKDESKEEDELIGIIDWLFEFKNGEDSQAIDYWRKCA